MPGVVKVFTYATLGLEAGVPVRLQPVRQRRAAEAADPGRRQGAHGRRAGRARRRRDGRAAARDAADRIVVDYDPLPVVIDAENAGKPGAAAAPRGGAGQPLPHDRAQDRGLRRRLRRGARQGLADDRQPAPLAGPDRAARRGRRLDHLERRAHVLHLDAGAALRAHVRLGDLRHPRVEGARDRARRRRRLRLEDRRLRRGVRARAGLAPDRAAREVDRDAHRAHGLDRRTAAISCRRPRSRPTRDGRMLALRVHLLQDCGAYLGAAHAEHRAPDGDHGAGRLRTCSTSTSSSTRSSRTRRRPTPTAAPGAPRRRTWSSGSSTAWPTSSASTRPRCGGSTSPPSSRTPRRPASSTTPATTRRRSTRRSRCPTTRASRRAAREAAARGNYRGIGLSTWVEICGLAPSAVTKAIGIGAGGWESSIVRLHPTGLGDGDHRLLRARPGPRDVLVADRRERARHPVRPGRGRSTATPASRPTASAPTARARSRSAARRCS